METTLIEISKIELPNPATGLFGVVATVVSIFAMVMITILTHFPTMIS